MKDLYTIALVFGDKPRYLAFGSKNNILPNSMRVTTKRSDSAKFTKAQAEKISIQVKGRNLGEKQIRIESMLFDSDI